MKTPASQSALLAAQQRDTQRNTYVKEEFMTLEYKPCLMSASPASLYSVLQCTALTKQIKLILLHFSF